MYPTTKPLRELRGGPTLRSNPLIDSAELERLHAQAYSWAVTCTAGNTTEAEDVLQTTYLAILEGRARYDGRASLRTWLFAVVRTTAKSLWRRTRRSALQFVAADGRTELSIPAAAPGPAEQQVTQDARVRVLEAWRALPPRQREVLDLVFYRELSIADAAQVMRIGIGAARQHYERAKATLRLRLDEDG